MRNVLRVAALAAAACALLAVPEPARADTQVVADSSGPACQWADPVCVMVGLLGADDAATARAVPEGAASRTLELGRTKPTRSRFLTALAGGTGRAATDFRVAGCGRMFDSGLSAWACYDSLSGGLAFAADSRDGRVVLAVAAFDSAGEARMLLARSLGPGDYVVVRAPFGGADRLFALRGLTGPRRGEKALRERFERETDELAEGPFSADDPRAFPRPSRIQTPPPAVARSVQDALALIPVIPAAR